MLRDGLFQGNVTLSNLLEYEKMECQVQFQKFILLSFEHSS